MKTTSSPLRKILRRGYTLMELSLAMMTGMMIAAMLLAIFNQQVAFLKIFGVQSFLTTEAPIINNYLTRVIGSAEGYKIYPDLSTLKGNGADVLTGGSALALLFREPDGTSKSAILCYEADTGFTFRRIVGNTVSNPEWSLSNQVRGVNFSVEEGVLTVTLTGPNQETITYAGAQQL